MQGVTAAMPPLFWPNLVEHIQFVDGRGGFKLSPCSSCDGDDNDS